MDHFSIGNSHSLFNPATNQSKSSYGSETINSINSHSSVNLKGTIVQNKVNAAGSVNACNANIGSISAGGKASLNNTVCHHIVNAGESVDVVNSNLNGVNAGGSITAGQCPELGILNAGGRVEVRNCEEIRSILAGSHVEIHNSKVSENVTAGSSVLVNNSEISGTLSYSYKHITIKSSHISNIQINSSNSFSGIIAGNCNFSASNQYGTMHISNVRGLCTAVNHGNMSMVDNGTSTVIINDGSFIYDSSSRQPNQNNQIRENPEKQIIELCNGTSVGNITFKGGNGEVILRDGSTVTGTISGGRIIQH